jgi:glycerol-3-phosphate dehydrogenase
MAFSGLDRNTYKATIQQNEYDILVIGGGITGAGIALDAITRGLKVALVEKNDFGAGTSSRSTKLIHGGLRYLKQLELGIVREVGRERAILYKNAPHIVLPEKMMLPIIKGGSLGKKSTSLGLYVYDRLAGVVRSERRYMQDKKSTERAEPQLRKDVLLGSGMYIEYRSDDARLVIEVLKSAIERGAIALNYTEVQQFSYNNTIIDGVRVKDVIHGDNYAIKAKKIINAAGPWVDVLRDSDGSLSGKRLHLTKGIHIVIPKKSLPIKQSVYFDIPTDGRMAFAIPRGNIVYIGTTDTNYKEDKDACFASSEDVDYVIAAANYMFPAAKLNRDSVLSTWCGLRPLIHEEGKSPSDLSRKDEIFVSTSGLMSIAGGKLTGFRKMAERIVNLALKQLKKEQQYKYVQSSTANIPLSGGDKNKIKDIYAQYPSIDQAIIQDLIGKYGSNSDKILTRMKSIYSNIPNGILLAEADYAIEQECCICPADFLIRRSGRLYFERQFLSEHYPVIREHFKKIFNYTDALDSYFDTQYLTEYEGVMRWKQQIA